MFPFKSTYFFFFFLLCHEAVWDPSSPTGMEPVPPQWKLRVLVPGPSEKSLKTLFLASHEGCVQTSSLLLFSFLPHSSVVSQLLN